jgi:hypothetical protein
MNEIDALRTFRARVAEPSAAARAGARTQLETAVRAASAGVRGPSLRPPGTSTARQRLVAAGIAAFAVAAHALTVSAPWRGGPTVLERAQAALAPDGRILHVVARVVGRDGVTRGESWVLADGSVGRTVSLSGEAPSECLAYATELRCWDPRRGVVDVYRYNPEAVEKGKRFAEVPQVRMDQPESVSRALGAGYARLLGESTIDGRAVYAVRLAVPRIGPDGSVTPLFLEGQSSTLYVDRATYYPVAQRFPDAQSTTHYETFEFLPDDAEHRKLVRLDVPVGAPIVVHPVGQGPPG